MTRTPLEDHLLFEIGGASVGRKLRTLESVLESKTLAAGVVRPKADQTTR
jgi:hypothetical protein